jgi:PAS domain S-box-containing protein
MTEVRILVAAPESTFSAELERSLACLGYLSLGRTSCGQEAVRLAAELRPDLVLLDVELPEPVDGPAAAARIRRHVGLPAVLLVPVAKPALGQVLSAAPDGVVFPPFSPPRVGAAVELALARHRTEDELRRQAGRLAALLDGIADPVVAADGQGRVTSLNAAAELLTGYPRDEALQRSFRDILPLRDELAREPLPDPIRWAFDQGQEPGVALLPVQGGAPIPVSVTAGRVADHTGAACNVVLVLRDLRADRRREEHARFTAKMEAVGQLAGGVAHQFNNLLTVVTGYSDVLADAMGPSHPWWGFVEEIRKAGTQAAEVTRHLFSLTRTEMLQPRVLDLHQVVLAAVPALQRALGERVEVLTELGPAVPSIRADPGQLAEILQALAANAREAMPEGGRFLIQTAAMVVSEADARTQPGLRAGRWALLRLGDTGTGMPEGIRVRAFEPYFSTKGPAQGLGLAAVHSAVNQNGGHVELSSVVGQGTTVSIYLPAAAQPGGLAGLSFPGLLSGFETVLLAEDEPMVRDLNRQILQMCGYSVLEAGDGLEALAVGAQHPGRIDLLVTDVVMPRLNGPALAESLAAQRPGIKVLFLSGGMDGEAGPLPEHACFLAKPYSVSDLARTVRELLHSPDRTADS